MCRANQISSEMSNARNSPLIRLPGELRNNIYGYLLVGVIPALRMRGERVVLVFPNKFRALTEVSRQIREETTSYNPEYNQVYFPYDRLDEFSQDNIYSNIRHIREILIVPAKRSFGEGNMCALRIGRFLELCCSAARL